MLPRFSLPDDRFMHAVKVDENNVQKAKAYTALALEHDPSLIHANFSTKALLDHEVLLMQAFECELLLFSVHPDLAELLADLKRHPQVGAAAFPDTAHRDTQARPRVSQCAWSIACDAYCSRGCLMESPPSVALACVVLAAQLLQVRTLCSAWIAYNDTHHAGRIAAHRQPTFANLAPPRMIQVCCCMPTHLRCQSARRRTG